MIEEYSMKTATTYDERINLIREIAERRKKMARVKKQSKVLPKKVKKVKRDFMEVPKEGDNVYAWTDASKYAQQYYGETLYETRRFDNEWD